MAEQQGYTGVIGECTTSDKATAKVAIAEDSLMKCSEALDIHFVLFTCLASFACTHHVDCCTSMCGYMWLHVSSCLFMCQVGQRWTDLNCPTAPWLLVVAQAEMPFLKGIEVLPKEDAQVVLHAMPMHVHGIPWSIQSLFCTWMYLDVLGRSLLDDLYGWTFFWSWSSAYFGSLDLWRSLCQRCEPVTWPSRRRWQQKVRPWRFSGAKSPRPEALAADGSGTVGIFRNILLLYLFIHLFI